MIISPLNGLAYNSGTLDMKGWLAWLSRQLKNLQNTLQSASSAAQNWATESRGKCQEKVFICRLMKLADPVIASLMGFQCEKLI